MASASGDSDEPALSRRRPRPPEDANPTIRQRELGNRLRTLRNQLGLTVDDVASELMCSVTKISRMETGTRRASLRDVRDLCRIYGVTDPAEAEQLMDLARRAREPGWWTQYDEPLLSPLLGLEQEATAITSYSMYFVPALLQTAEYARELIKAIERKIDATALDHRVNARLHRQQLLDQPNPPRYRALLDEAVLRRQVGGPKTMHAQLGKIISAATEEKIKATVQIIPFTAGAHASTDSQFDFLDFGPGSFHGPVVFVEGLFANRYWERPAEIERYREAIEYLRDSALNPRDSISLIAQIRSTHAA